MGRRSEQGVRKGGEHSAPFACTVLTRDFLGTLLVVLRPQGVFTFIRDPDFGLSFFFAQ
jgi:hypothetical protein